MCKDRPTAKLLIIAGLISFVAGVWLIGRACPAAPATEGSVKVWHLINETYNVGQLSVLACEQGVRIDIPKCSLAVVAAAPDWKVYILNADDKIFFPTTAEKLRSAGIVSTVDHISGNVGVADERQLWKNFSTRNATLCGIKTICLSAPVKFSVPVEGPSSASSTKNAKVWHITKVEYYSTLGCRVPASGLKIIQALYKVPQQGGLPVALVYSIFGRSPSSFLVCSEYKEEQTSLSRFRVPFNYKLAKEQGELVGKKMSKGFEDWSNDMGIGAGLGSKMQEIQRSQR